jgi:hypothetical protein
MLSWPGSLLTSLINQNYKGAKRIHCKRLLLIEPTFIYYE